MEYFDNTDAQHEETASPLIVKVRVNASSALKARQIITRFAGAKLVSCDWDDRYATLGIAITDREAFQNPYNDPDEDWPTMTPLPS